jgi:methionyl-tRNA formyltransferase
MLESVIIISPKEFHPGISAIFQNTNPSIEIICTESIVDLALLDQAVFKRSRLISFFNEHIIPPAILQLLGYGGVNFHPGPPNLPGHAPYSFAIYQEAKIHGVTAHEMLDRVDSGRIIAVESFPIPELCNQTQLIHLCIEVGAGLLKKLAHFLSHKEHIQFSSNSWDGIKTTKMLFASMCKISCEISEKELSKRIRAFGAGDGTSLPSMMLNGTQYIYIFNSESNSSKEISLHRHRFAPINVTN